MPRLVLYLVVLRYWGEVGGLFFLFFRLAAGGKAQGACPQGGPLHRHYFPRNPAGSNPGSPSDSWCCVNRTTQWRSWGCLPGRLLQLLFRDVCYERHTLQFSDVRCVSLNSHWHRGVYLQVFCAESVAL